MIESTVTNSYLEAAVWSSLDWDDKDDSDNPRPLDDNYSWHDFTDEAKAEARADCERFIRLLEGTACKDYDNLFDAADNLQGLECIGHDFWLTRNGHGAGFWDGDYAEYGDAICEVLYNEFGRYAELNIFVNADERLEFDA